MDNRSRQNYLNILRQSYSVASWSDKTKIINEVCRNLGWHRQSAIRALNQCQTQNKSKASKRPKKYCWQAQYHLRKLWLSMEQMCSKKMVVALPVWLKNYDDCSDDIKQQLICMSAATIDRYLKKYRASHKRRLRWH